VTRKRLYLETLTSAAETGRKLIIDSSMKGCSPC